MAMEKEILDELLKEKIRNRCFRRAGLLGENLRRFWFSEF